MIVRIKYEKKKEIINHSLFCILRESWWMIHRFCPKFGRRWINSKWFSTYTRKFHRSSYMAKRGLACQFFFLFFIELFTQLGNFIGSFWKKNVSVKQALSIGWDWWHEHYLSICWPWRLTFPEILVLYSI